MNFKELAKNRIALLALLIISSLYAGAILAPFFSPYPYDEDDVKYLWAPPSRVHFFDFEKKIFFRPFVYGRTFYLDDFYRRVYVEDKTRIFPLKFFTKGFSYRIFGLFECRRHLFGVEGAKVYLLGGDLKGRDILSRILYGSRISLSIGLIGAAVSFVIGIFIGAVSGYFGGKTDNIIMRLVEMIMMVPSFYLMLALRASFPPNLSSSQVYLLLVVILSFIGWASIARVIRGMALSLREQDYVYAAKSMGVGHFKIIARHIMPHTFSYAIVAIVLSIPGYILGEAALSLLGLGIQEPEASWGNLLSGALGIVNIKLFPWILIPGLFIVITAICFNILGEALRDIYDPKRRIVL